MYEEEESDIHRRYELNERIQILQQWIDQQDENDIYFDCPEDDSGGQELVEIYPQYQPWISEIRLSVHRRTSLFRRIFNRCYQTKRSSLKDLAAEFIRIYNGRFDYPLGFRFHLSHDKEKWLLILKNITLNNYPVYPYPPTRIIFLHKDYFFVAR